MPGPLFLKLLQMSHVLFSEHFLLAVLTEGKNQYVFLPWGTWRINLAFSISDTRHLLSHMYSHLYLAKPTVSIGLHLHHLWGRTLNAWRSQGHHGKKWEKYEAGEGEGRKINTKIEVIPGITVESREKLQQINISGKILKWQLIILPAVKECRNNADPNCSAWASLHSLDTGSESFCSEEQCSTACST